jgi:predicted transcriptional regulator
MVKLTFSLDEDTVRQLRRLATRANKPQSLIVREAIARYAADPADVRISEEERDRKLAIICAMRSRTPSRTAADADAELQRVREARHSPQRLHPPD